MSAIKVLITGGSGFLGYYLNKTLNQKFQILTLYNTHIGNCINFNSLKLNITDTKKLKEIFSSFKPNIVIHTAAVSNPSEAQSLPAKAVYNTNVNAVKNLAELCELFGAKLIYLSTDLVYAGYRGSMLEETAKLVPVSLYAETKLMGEVKIKETFENYIILRCALLFGINKYYTNNHFSNCYFKLKNMKPIKLFTDQFRTPISAPEASKLIFEICSSGIKNETVNFGGKERVSRFELIEMLCNLANLNKDLLIECSMNEFNELPLVADVSMNTNKLASLGFKQKSLEEMIKEVLKNISE